MTLALGNLGHVAVMRERYAEAVDLNREGLLLCISRGDKRGGVETLLSLAAAVAGLGRDELSVRLDAIHRTMAAEGGLIDRPQLVERLEPPLRAARTRLGGERIAALEAEAGAVTLEHALELLDASTG